MKKENWDQYSNYLRLDLLLNAQEPWSFKSKTPGHDEMLFVIFHQVYELWFKQILFELDDVQTRLSAPIVGDNDMQPILSHLNRIVDILNLLVRQIDILETMTPQDFIDFREHLKTASGFQSWQFRLIETRLGLRREDRIPVFHAEFDAQLSTESRKFIQMAESTPSLFELLDQWLSRTPFVAMDNYKFGDEYKSAVQKLFTEKEDFARNNLDGEAQEKELTALTRGRQKFEAIFDESTYNENGQWRMSLKGLQAALFITVYRDEPILQIPSRLLSHIMDVDELLAQWRYRHALMVQRMMGMSVGTGGSSGYGYLLETLEKHRIFTDLFALSTYLIPSRLRPDLPTDLREKMTYKHNAAA
ncbi:MAG: tryptophan 2,3-dioxygenase [Alphaproteobacteria bacterium]|nr:tryptophan 2,3-dioxygenase [Alphaproteobacteria bacterium]MBU0859494.1 tryptophan 2,3-dioxygenase [Alphaproteobacteria bacterium]